MGKGFKVWHVHLDWSVRDEHYHMDSHDKDSKEGQHDSWTLFHPQSNTHSLSDHCHMCNHQKRRSIAVTPDRWEISCTKICIELRIGLHRKHFTESKETGLWEKGIQKNQREFLGSTKSVFTWVKTHNIACTLVHIILCDRIGPTYFWIVWLKSTLGKP